MAHSNIYDLITMTLELKRKDKEKEELLADLYNFVDEYNDHIRSMDKKLDRLVDRFERLVDDGY